MLKLSKEFLKRSFIKIPKNFFCTSYKIKNKDVYHVNEKFLKEENRLIKINDMKKYKLMVNPIISVLLTTQTNLFYFVIPLFFVHLIHVDIYFTMQTHFNNTIRSIKYDPELKNILFEKMDGNFEINLEDFKKPEVENFEETAIFKILYKDVFYSLVVKRDLVELDNPDLFKSIVKGDVETIKNYHY